MSIQDSTHKVYHSNICGICEKEYTQPDRVTTLACNHIYHSDCFNHNVDQTPMDRQVKCLHCAAPTGFAGRREIEEAEDDYFGLSLIIFCVLSHFLKI